MINFFKHSYLASYVQLAYNCVDLESHNIELIITSDVNCKIIAIRGSESTMDWVNNARLFPVPSPTFGLIHAGYYVNCRLALKSIIRDIGNDKDKPLVIAGHSKGGPEAVILARLLQLKGYTIGEVVTFGAPQFINRWGARRLDDNLIITQYRNGFDLVTQLPSSKLHVYQHISPLVCIGEHRAHNPIGAHNIARYYESLIEHENKADRPLY